MCQHAIRHTGEMRWRRVAFHRTGGPIIEGLRIAPEPLVRKRGTSALLQSFYLPPLFLPALLSVPGPTLPCPEGLRASPLFMPPCFIPAPAPVPVVMPD